MFREGVDAVLVEQYTFQNIWSFLYIELCRAVQAGNALWECRLCGRRLLHK
ncbi:DUF6076 domain-containing protein [Oscillibacter sp. KLE 1745]|uniref:DUF6076 domain-containing protein n=1 Tax=Oscillospiraceae TaxID=216572 RepID=UPI00346467BD